MATNGARGPMDAFVVMRKRSAIFGHQARDDGEDELSMAAGPSAGAGQNGPAAAASENEEEEESFLPLVTSDLLEPSRRRKPEPPLQPPPAATPEHVEQEEEEEEEAEEEAEEDETGEKEVTLIKQEEQDDQEDEFLPLVTSDLLRPGRPKLSQRPRSTIAKPMATPAVEPSQPRPNKMRLAVHIRSSPATPVGHIKPPANHELSTLPSKQSRIQARTEELKLSKLPKLPKLPKPPKTPKTPKMPQTPNRSPTNNGYPKPDVMIKTPRPRPVARPMDPNSRSRKREARTDGYDQETKRRVRRSPELSLRARYLQSEPEYIPYKCDWDISKDSQQGKRLICPAELHNIDTLRKHVYYVHGDADPLVCRFSHCKDHEPPPTFKTEKDFERHMEKKHFVAYLWHMGEGYQNNGTWLLEKKPGELPAYLFDQKGNQVTPSVAGQQVESHLEHKRRKRRVRQLLYEQNENAISEEEWMKQMLGTD
ncbi:hypothetical protein F4861DRAFT_500719 [Xylaria intraflava]|nr:hypothetical protein F4861DRAFT_500719 [Xylaria intraflava]